MTTQVRALNFTQRIIQGDSFNKAYTMKTIDTETGIETPIDLSNKTIRGQIRVTPNSPDPVDFSTSTFASPDGGGIIDTFAISLSSLQTTPLVGGTYMYDVDITDPNTTAVQTVLKGNFIVRSEITK